MTFDTVWNIKKKKSNCRVKRLPRRNETEKTKGTKRERNGGWKWKKISQDGPVNCTRLKTDGQPQWRYLRRPWKSFWFEEKTWKGRQQIGEIIELTALCYVWWKEVKKCVLEATVHIWSFDQGKKDILCYPDFMVKLDFCANPKHTASVTKVTCPIKLFSQ